MTEPVESWSRLEAENLGTAGIFQLRLFGETSLDLFAVLELPEHRVGIKLEVAARRIPSVGVYPTAGGFRTRADRVGDRTRITVLLEVPDFRAVFGEMCTDVLRWCLLAGSDEARAVRNLVDRLDAWKELFRGIGPNPLTEEEQLGLYGELLFLETLLDHATSAGAAVEMWRGPLRDIHDFHVGATHVEVKTTAATGVAVARVAGLRQLDPRGLDALLLWHYRLQIGGGGIGRTLMSLIHALRTRLTEDNWRATFDDRLLKAQYLDIHAPSHYDSSLFTIAGTIVFAVDQDFPALTMLTVPSCIREAWYELTIDAISNPAPLANDVAIRRVVEALGSRQ